MSAPQYTPGTNNGQLPEDSSSSVPTLDVSELDDYYTDNGEKISYLSLDNKISSNHFIHCFEYTVWKKDMFCTKACTRVEISQFLRTLQVQKNDIIFSQDAHFINCKNQVVIYLGWFK